jgi:hypothetical protein
MFHRTIHNHTVFPETLRFEEHRAPTDESVKILREMEQAARDAIIARMTVETTYFHAEVMVMRRSWQTDDVGICKINLNGKDITFEHKLPSQFEVAHQRSVHWLIDKLYEAIHHEVSKALVEQIVHKDTYIQVLTGA